MGLQMKKFPIQKWDSWRGRLFFCGRPILDSSGSLSGHPSWSFVRRYLLKFRVFFFGIFWGSAGIWISRAMKSFVWTCSILGGCSPSGPYFCQSTHIHKKEHNTQNTSELSPKSKDFFRHYLFMVWIPFWYIILLTTLFHMDLFLVGVLEAFDAVNLTWNPEPWLCVPEVPSRSADSNGGMPCFIVSKGYFTGQYPWGHKCHGNS